MPVIVITPAEAAVTAADAKAWAPALAALSDEDVEALIAVAQQSLEPPGSWLGCSFSEVTLELRLDGWHNDKPARNIHGRYHAVDFRSTAMEPWAYSESEIRLAFPPVTSVTSVKYDDLAGAEQTLSTDVYQVVGIGTTRPSIVLKDNQTWPVLARKRENVRIRYEAGVDAASATLNAYKRALVLGASQVNQVVQRDLSISRERVDGVGEIQYVVSDVASTVMRQASGTLLEQYKVWWP